MAFGLRMRRITMPIGRYFLVAGPALFGLLLLADAKLPPAGPIANSTAFHGLHTVPRSGPVIATLTVRTAPAPDMSSPAVLAAAPPPPPGTAASPAARRAAPERVVAAVAPPPKKRKRAVRPRAWPHDYAEFNPWRDGTPTRLW